MSAVVVVSLLAVLAVAGVQGARYTVGDSDGWKPGVNYTLWASKQKYFPGDYLVFNYPEGQDTVYEVKKASYDKCDTSSYINYHNDGKSAIRITRPISHYFISGTADHCARGQKLVVDVINPNPHGGPAPQSLPEAPPPSSGGSSTAAGNSTHSAALSRPGPMCFVAFSSLAMFLVV